MKIEVGKAYRTRGGWKAVVERDDNSSCQYKAWHFFLPGEEKHVFWHFRDGSVNIKDCAKYDLISEWTDEPAAAPKYRAGDLVTVCLKQNDADNWNHYCPWKNQIVSHTPAPFDWKDVRPGMAFKDYAGTVWRFIAYDKMDAQNKQIVCFSRARNEYKAFLETNLTRAHEHDIEVAE